MGSVNDTTQDLWGYLVHADLLQKIILNESMLPISIGVFGNWGSGKSSLMLLLKKGIESWIEGIQKSNTALPTDGVKENDKILQVNFNSWQFESYDSTKLTMIETILDALSNDINEKKDVFEKADDFFARIKFLKAGVFILKKLHENLTPDCIKKWLPSEEELDVITGKDKYNKLMEDVRKGNTSKFIETFRNLFEELVKDAAYKAVVVYIDDLDRCDPRRIIECLEAVKLFVNVDRTAFVIGADERIIEYAISQHYPIKMKKEDISSPFSDYLEKLIQLPYKIPKLSDNEQETYITLLLCKNHLRRMDFEDVHKKYKEFRKSDKHSKYNIEDIKEGSPNVDFQRIEYMLPIVPLIKQFLNGNPRQLKRFMNTLYVRKELAEVAGFDEIRPDVLVKLMVLEYNTLYALRFEDLYKKQRENGGMLQIAQVEEQATTTEGVQDPLWKEDWSSDYLRRWLAAKPLLDGINLQNYFWVARDALKNEKPVASLVTSKVMLMFKRLCVLQSSSLIRKELPNMLKDCDDSEKEMLIRLINEKLCSNSEAIDCWRILVGDENNLLVDNNVDRLKLLFHHVKTDKVDPQAAPFFTAMLSIEGEIHDYIESLPKGGPLMKAIKVKQKMIK